jgi:uncharacterized protein (TIGR03437 family)
MRCLLLLAVALPLLRAQAPTAPVISARGVTNFFTQEPAPGTVAQGGLVQIAGLNLGPVEGAIAAATPWPNRLADVQVVIGGKPAALYSVSPGLIIAQVAPDANLGLVDAIVRRTAGASKPAKVTVAALAPSIRTAKDTGFGAPWGTADSAGIVTTASGLGPTNEDGTPKADLTAFVGGLPAKVAATASTKRPGEFDVNIAVPAGATAGDPITLIANRQRANLTIFQPVTTPEVDFVPLPDRAPAITNLTDTDVNGRFLLATGARSSDGCYAAISADMARKSVALASDCLTTSNAAAAPGAAPPNSDAIAALVGPPSGDAQTGISSTVKIFSASASPLTVMLPSPATTLTTTAAGMVAAVLPGTPPQTAIVDPETGAVQVVTAGAGGGAAGAAAGGAPTPAVDIGGLKNVYASATVAQNRIAVIAGDDPLKPAKAVFAIVSPAGDVVSTKDFPAGWLPLLNAVAPVRAGAPAAAPPREPSTFDTATRQFFVLARAADASKDAFIAIPIGNGDPKIAAFPDGWFAASCTADMRLLALDLSGQVAIAGSKAPDADFKSSCPGAGFLLLDFAAAAVTAVPLPDQGLLRVPSTRTDTSLSQMNNYVFGARLDTTRTGTSDTVYVLDGVNASSFLLPMPVGVSGFSDAGLQQIPELNALLAQTIDRIAGDQGLVLLSLDLQTVVNLPVPDGFTTVAPIEDNGTACCLATRKLLARALKQGGSNLVYYDLLSNELTVVPNPEGVTSFGAAGGGANAAANAARLMSANARANTVFAVAYNGNRQIGIIVVRIP